MSKFSITGSSPPLTENDLKVFEDKFDMALPSEYRQFLLRFNGGIPSIGLFNYNDPLGPNVLSVRRFIPIDPNDSFDLLKMMHYRDSGLPSPPKNLFPFAEDSGGNTTCISVSGENVGKIYFWEHDRPEKSSVTFVANSFNEFLAGLYEEPYAPIKQKMSIWHRLFQWLGRK